MVEHVMINSRILIFVSSLVTCTYPLHAQWLQTDFPYGGSVNSFTVGGINLFAGTSGGVFVSSDSGTSWSAASTGLTIRYVNALLASDTNLFAGTDGGVFLSTNNASSWIAVGLVGYYVNALTMSGTHLFAGTSSGGGARLSTDNGKTWIAVNTGLTSTSVRAFASHRGPKGSDTSLFAGTIDGVFLSNDNGSSWTAAKAGMPSTVVWTLAANDTCLFAGTNSGVFLSTNKGTGWASMNAGLANTSVYALIISGTNLFAGTGSGVFVSTNNGTSWAPANTGMTGFSVNALTVFPGSGGSGTYLFAGTNGGVWRRPLSQMVTSVDRFSTDVPTNFGLEQNYPNPFNPTTTISFSLPSKSYVSLKVIDILGREVVTLVSEEMSGGTYSSQWNTVNMPSGVYFYRLRAGEFVKTEKMILMR
jgi:hypothetical protein